MEASSATGKPEANEYTENKCHNTADRTKNTEQIESDQSETYERAHKKHVKEEKSAIFETRLETALERKGKGNVLFKEKRYIEALKLYESGLYHIEFDELSWNFELMDKHRKQVNEIRLPLLLNCAASYLHIHEQSKIYESTIKEEKKENQVLSEHKQGEQSGETLRPKEAGLIRNALTKALELCNEALNIDEKNAKALFRRGQAQRKQGNLEKAVADMKSAAQIEPTNRAIRTALQEAINSLKEENSKSAAFWKQQLEKLNLKSATEKSESICTRILRYLESLFYKSDKKND